MNSRVKTTVMALLIAGMLQACEVQIHEEVVIECTPTLQFVDVCNNQEETILIDHVFIFPDTCETVDITPDTLSCDNIDTHENFDNFVIFLESLFDTVVVIDDDTILIF